MSSAQPAPRAVPVPEKSVRGGVRLERPAPGHMHAFLDAVARSRALHRHWVAPPDTPAAYRAYLQRTRDGNCAGHLVFDADDELVGAVNIGEILRGAFQSGQLGYYVFAPHAGRGLMRQAVRQVVTRAFRDYGLHRLEADVQPDNAASRALVRELGFRLEGYSPRYLKIAGRWRDHERWAITAGEWRARRALRAVPAWP